MEPNRPASPGSVDDVRERLLLWCKRAESGLARVEFTSEAARQRVVQGLRQALRDIGIVLHEIALPAGMDAPRLVRDLLSRLDSLSPGVVSIDGFASALPQDPEARAAALYRFNLYRERLSHPRQRQIWWMPPHFAETFVRVVPDLDSWFLVKLQLTEEYVVDIETATGVDMVGRKKSGSRLSQKEARRLADQYVQRLLRGLEQGLPEAELAEQLLLPAVTVLRQGGLDDEATALERRFQSESGDMAASGAAGNESALERAEALQRRGRRFHEGLRYQEAESLYREALGLAEAAAPDSPTLANILTNLAQLLKGTNRLAEAEPLMRRALAIDETSYGADHPDVAIDLNNLALLLQATNRLAEAEPLMRRALAIDEASYGADHPNVAIRLNNLATLLQAANRLAEAEPLMRQALAIADASYGADHPQVAIGLNNLAHLLKATNRLAEAEPLMRRCLEILVLFTLRTGHRHPHLSAAIGNYDNLLAAMGRDESERQAAIDALMESVKQRGIPD